jgi:photosystem II stability/assembly factor-like uncharacterized protein
MKQFFTLFSLFLFYSSANAQAWEEQAFDLLPVGYGVFGISVVDENIVWAVIFDQTTSVVDPVPLNHVNKVLKTVDGGASWEVFEVEEATGRISFDITAFDANTAFITTQDFNNGNGKGVFKTEDGGDTWVEKYHHLSGGVWLRFFNEQEGVIINRNSIATTDDGGETWQLVPSSNIPTFDANEFTLLTSGNNSCQMIDDHIWFGTSKGRVYRSKDKGYTWEAFSTPFGSNAVILSVAFQDTLNGIALDINGPLFTRFSVTSDGGETWENQPASPPLFVGNVAAIPGTEGHLIATSAYTSTSGQWVSAYSTDFGASWEILDEDIPYGGTQFLSEEIGWTSNGRIDVAGQPAMYKWLSPSVDVMEAFSLNDYEVYPNPVSDQLQVDLPADLSAELSLLDMNGRVMRHFRSNGAMEISVQGMPAGLYWLRLIDDQGQVSVKRVVVE